MSLAQVAVIVRCYRELLNQFEINLDRDVPMKEPEFGYQMLGVMRSLVGVLEAELDTR